MKHNVIKPCGGEEVQLHAFFTSAPTEVSSGGEWVGPGVILDTVDKRNVFALPGTKSQINDLPAYSLATVRSNKWDKLKKQH
jgi:hypothetical protein